MAIALTKAQIDAALPKVAKGLHQYVWLQANRDAGDVRSNAAFKRRFNHFYRVRRDKKWQDHFYRLLETLKGRAVCFPDLFDALYRATGRCEASFASKLLATLDPNMPVIDAVVLGNRKLTLPAAGSRDRIRRIHQLHATLLSSFQEYLATAAGRYLVTRFRETYGGSEVSEIKMLDLVLWQTRVKTTSRSRQEDERRPPPRRATRACG